MSPRSQEIKQSGLFGFLAQPDAPTKSGVVMLATIFGVNAFMRGYAETLARAGLAAAVWDHYEGLPLITDQEESKRRSRSITDAAMHGKVKAWIDYMHGELGLTSVGVLGFCLGGRFAPMVAAGDKRIKACAAGYPSIENPRHPNQEQDAVALAAGIACPTLVIQPGHDHVATPETYAALKETRCSSARRRPYGNTIPTPSTASCIARSRRPTRRRPRSPRRNWSASCRAASREDIGGAARGKPGDECGRNVLLQTQRRAETHRRDRARAHARRVQAARGSKYMDGTFPWDNIRSSPRSACSACRCPRNMAGSACRCSTPRWCSRRSPRAATSPRWRCSARSACRPASSPPTRPEPIKRRILPTVCTGECILAICMTEPHAGTDVAELPHQHRHQGRPRAS